MARTLSALGPPPPASSDYYSAVESIVGGQKRWGVFGNDLWGDCVCADEAHYLMLRTANAGQIVIPTDDDIAGPGGLYALETGFDPDAGPPDGNPTDQGTDEASDCAYMVSTGLLGHKAEATGPIDPTNLDHIRWAIQLFGACKIGFGVQQAQRDQFDDGSDWDFVPHSPWVGDHDVPLVAYYADGSFDCISWGERHHCAPGFVSPRYRLIEEAHALVFPDWMKQGGTAPCGFDMPTLLQDALEIEVAAMLAGKASAILA